MFPATTRCPIHLPKNCLTAMLMSFAIPVVIIIKITFAISMKVTTVTQCNKIKRSKILKKSY